MWVRERERVCVCVCACVYCFVVLVLAVPASCEVKYLLLLVVLLPFSLLYAVCLLSMTTIMVQQIPLILPIVFFIV